MNIDNNGNMVGGGGRNYDDIANLEEAFKYQEM